MANEKVIVKEINWDNIDSVEKVVQLLKEINLKFVFDKKDPNTKSKIDILKFQGIID